MSDDYAKATAAAPSVVIDGKEYRVGKFGPVEVGDLQAWLKEQVPDPRVLARELIRDVPDAVAIAIWKDMHEDAKSWPPAFDSPTGLDLILKSFEGNVRLLWVTLRRHNGVTLDEARRLARTLDGTDLLAEVVRKASPEAVPDPKATTGTGMGPDPAATPT